jgi:hypothetical protein
VVPRFNSLSFSFLEVLMADRFTASRSQLMPDARYGSKLASKFINCLMKDGKKSIRSTPQWT